VLSLQLVDIYPWRLIYRFRLVSLDVPRNLLLPFIPYITYLFQGNREREKCRWQESSSSLFRGFPFWYTLVISDSLTTRPVELEMSTVTTFFPAEERNRRGVKREKEKKNEKSERKNLFLSWSSWCCCWVLWCLCKCQHQMTPGNEEECNEIVSRVCPLTNRLVDIFPPARREKVKLVSEFFFWLGSTAIAVGVVPTRRHLSFFRSAAAPSLWV
jgi:hypothetical protein